MRLSVIIVNYNVRHFLEQALLSVRKAAEGLAVEIWVVDNNSVDDSVAMVEAKFPEVRLIVNKDNVGFSKANNQAILASQSDYVLLLNPDTVVQEDTFHKVLTFMDLDPSVGGLGVRTIDGSGKFLPESKRGFPTPWVAFCKSFGLSALFPKSAFFNAYYVGDKSEFETCEVDILVGSFMLLRREALEKVGLLDEAFFMYGEDIDLSYRIQKGGYKNVYFAESTIIHYKGESTKKGSLNYVRVFYGAMIIFAKKHFQGQQATLFIALMQAAVWFRAALTVVSNFLKQAFLPLTDAILIVGGLWWLRGFWSDYYFNDPTYIKSDFLFINIPLYTTIWLSTIYLSGGYDAPPSLRPILRGVFLGTILLAAIYGFLEMPLRSSRMLIVLGALWASLALLGWRLLLHFIKYKNFRVGTEGGKNWVLVGSKTETERVLNLLKQAPIQPNIIGIVSSTDTDDHQNFLGSLRQLDEIVRIYRINEVVFCSKDVPANDIMTWMSRLSTGVEMRIVPEESAFIIGSSDKNTRGELYTIDIRFDIAQPVQRRNKRLFDLSFCGFLLFFFPILLSKSLFYKNWLSVFIGRKTWVGFTEGGYFEHLPRLKQGVFSPLDAARLQNPNAPTIERLNFLYAKDYTIGRDAEVVAQQIFSKK
jgi:GT2 family glycosyltransferase